MTIEKRLYIPLSDIQVLRLRCTGADCDGDVQLPIDKLLKATLICPSCGRVLDKSHAGEALRRFRLALAALVEDEHIAIDIVLPGAE